MAAARVSESSDRAGVLVGIAALVSGVFLGGCAYEPEPMPFPPSPVATLAPPLSELQVMLERFSEEMLREGATAVLIEVKVGREEWSHAAGVRSRKAGVRVELSDPVQVGGVTDHAEQSGVATRNSLDREVIAEPGEDAFACLAPDDDLVSDRFVHDSTIRYDRVVRLRPFGVLTRVRSSIPGPTSSAGWP